MMMWAGNNPVGLPLANGLTIAVGLLVEFRGLRRVGKGRGAEYAIRLGRILEIKRWRP
jgi:hypothetical protein